MRGPRKQRHGIAGEVLSIDDESIVILERGNRERILLLGSGTIVGNPGEGILFEDITVESHIVGFGRPDEEGNVYVRRVMLSPWEE